MISTRILSILAMVTMTFMAPSASANTISAIEMETVMEAADISNRIYLSKPTDYIKSNERYYASADYRDAVIVAVYTDKCIVGFRGTNARSTDETQDDGFDLEVVIAGIVDALINADNAEKREVVSKDNPSTTCLIGNGYYNAYHCDFYEDMEAQIDQDCVAQGLPITFTGHSQGAALAQIAAARYEAQEPQVTVFAPAPTFFDECQAVPHERITNFLNTEQELGGGDDSVQYDVVPFVDTFVTQMIDKLANFIGWGLPQFVVDHIVDSAAGGLTDFLVGSYKGEFFILSPNHLPSAAYQPRRELITGVELDLIDWEEFFDSETNDFAPQLFTSHSMDTYHEKLTILHEDSRRLVANGFETNTWCNDGHDFMCADFCAGSSPIALCSTGAQGQACGNNNDCDSGLYCDGDSECAPKLGWMSGCNEDSDCSSDWCFLWLCQW